MYRFLPVTVTHFHYVRQNTIIHVPTPSQSEHPLVDQRLLRIFVALPAFYDLKAPLSPPSCLVHHSTFLPGGNFWHYRSVPATSFCCLPPSHLRFFSHLVIPPSASHLLTLILGHPKSKYPPSGACRVSKVASPVFATFMARDTSRLPFNPR